MVVTTFEVETADVDAVSEAAFVVVTPFVEAALVLAAVVVAEVVA